MRVCAHKAREGQTQQGDKQDADRSGHVRHNITECGVKVACNYIAVMRR
jgi:hypothetical protein